MTARAFCLHMEHLLVVTHGREAVDAWLRPVPADERREARRAELAALGVEVA